MIWTRRIADEFWSGPVTPITFSLLAETMAEHMARRPLLAAGLPELAAVPVLLHHASHVYVNAELLGRVVGLLPTPVRSEGLLALLPAEVRAIIPPASLATSGHAVMIAARLLRSERDWTPWRRADAFDRACAEMRAAFATLPPPRAGESAAALQAEIARVRFRLGEYLEVVSWGVVYAYVFYHLTIELARRWAPDLVTERAAMTVGLPGVASMVVNDEARALGSLLAADPALLEMVRNHEASGAWKRIAIDQGALGDGFRRFLARHGHRLTARDLLHPAWRDVPEAIVELAAHLADGGHAASADPAERRSQATSAIERVIGRGPGGPLRRALFRSTLAAAQRYAALRENMRYHADFALARLRDLVLALGGRLVADGQLEAPIDTCFLTLEEITEAIGRGGNRRTFAAERRALFEHDRLAPPPLTLARGEATREQAAVDVPRAAAPGRMPGTILSGEVASPGRAQGQARVVRGFEDFASVGRGDVLVAAYADPTWTPILELASGLVLEAGGQLSHGAIAARELGIPALVNVPAATRAIRDGDTVLLDGTRGMVSIVAVRDA